MGTVLPFERRAGLEPATTNLEKWHSIQLSYPRADFFLLYVNKTETYEPLLYRLVRHTENLSGLSVVTTSHKSRSYLFIRCFSLHGCFLLFPDTLR